MLRRVRELPRAAIFQYAPASGRKGSSPLTEAAVTPTLKAMEVNLNPGLQAKLTRLAAARGSDTQALVEEAIERFVDSDEWFLREVEKGLAAAGRGEFIEHEDIGKLIDSRYPG